MSEHTSPEKEETSDSSAAFLGFARRVLFVVAVIGLVWSFYLANLAVLMTLTALILARISQAT